MAIAISIIKVFLHVVLIVLLLDLMVSRTTDEKEEKMKIQKLEEKIKNLEQNRLTIENAKIRDFFMRTNFVGKLTNKDLIKEFKESLNITFNEFKNNITNYINVNDFKIYFQKYKEYEQKQIIIDFYEETK